MPSKILIAYDISSNRCRQKVAKILENYGIRVNKSVFMCTIKTESQLNALLHSFQPIIHEKILFLYYLFVVVVMPMHGLKKKNIPLRVDGKGELKSYREYSMLKKAPIP